MIAEERDDVIAAGRTVDKHGWDGGGPAIRSASALIVVSPND